MAEVVLVTGGSGFVACHLVHALLAGGATVHATVRSVTNEAKLRPLHAMQAQYPGRLKLFAADLLSPGSFDAGPAGTVLNS